MSSIAGFNYRRVAAGGVMLHVAIGGSGPPLLLIHGFPQTHLTWHRVAAELARDYQVICPDLRGYGASDKPPGDPQHLTYSKRSMAADMAALMSALGHDSFFVAAHDRGARVAHRLALDNEDRVRKLCLMDIVPGKVFYENVDSVTATAYWHWFFLIQPAPLPERLLTGAPDLLVRGALTTHWQGKPLGADVMEAYLSAFRNPEAIHAACEDYRAGATVDIQHDTADLTVGRRIACPLLLLWSANGLVGRRFAPLDVWRDWADEIQGEALDCGHFLPEERPEEVVEALRRFLA